VAHTQFSGGKFPLSQTTTSKSQRKKRNEENKEGFEDRSEAVGGLM